MPPMRMAISILVVLATPIPALADAGATATALFEQGLKDMAAGNYKQACKELAASNAALPDSGTMGALAECLTADGRITSAWQRWRELADNAPTADLRADATDHASALAPRLPRFLVKLSTATPGLVVTVDGHKIDLDLTVPLPVDPGTFSVAATAPGYQEWRHDFHAAEGQVTSVEIPALVAARAPAGSEVAVSTMVDDPGRRRHTRRTLALATLGAGAATLVVGGLFGLKASSKWDAANNECGGDVDTCRDAASLARAQTDVQASRDAGLLSSVAVTAGAAIVVAGAVLWLTAPRVDERKVAWRVTPTLHPANLGLTVSRGF